MATHKRWIDDKTITILVQLSLDKHPDLPDVPLVMDFAKTDEQKQIFKLIFARQVMGRPFVAPPGMPKDRADALRKAFDDTMKDPEFLADAARIAARDHPGLRRGGRAAGGARSTRPPRQSPTRRRSSSAASRRLVMPAQRSVQS